MNIYLDYFNANGIDFDNILDNLSKYSNSAFHNQSEIVIKDYYIPDNSSLTHTKIHIDGYIQAMYNGVPIRDWNSSLPINVNIYDESMLVPDMDYTEIFEYSLIGNSILIKHTDTAKLIRLKMKYVEKDHNSMDVSVKEKLEELYYNLAIRSDNIYNTLKSLSTVKNNVLAMNTKVKPITRVKNFKPTGISLRT